MNLINSIIEVIKNNQLLLTGLGLSGAGIITFWIKDVPYSIFRFLKRELTTELIVTNQNKIFYEILKWIEKNYKNKNFRKLKLTNGKWGYEDDTTTSIGYGKHWIKYKNCLFLIDLNKETANQSDRDKEILIMTKLGRSRKIFDEFVKEVSILNQDLNKVKLYKMEDGWHYVKDQCKRKLDSVFIEKYKKDLLIKTLSDFINNEQWYIDNGIPYQLGILLYGAPGTGKTSLIKAIASYLDYSIYYLSPQKLSKIELAMSTLPDKCIVVIEDIDGNAVTHSRTKEPNQNNETNDLSELIKINLSEVLNSLDGMFYAHGRILIATTNHVKKLDEALIRPGRIDLKVEIGYVNTEILKDFIDHFFPNNKIDFNSFKIKSNITVAMLQNMLLQGKNEYEIIDNVKI